ncbi:glycosyltransferase family 2 protein [Ornithinimicrobium cryptoxanthini]|uniref:glycosyltransferase family 2 protein n=1 Tax=Ornithinimicrobium cryptoxanthini TaxID=2934161 RepID=UPI00351C953D
MPEVSVVLIVRNGAATIRRQLDALSIQDSAAPFEVVVVDNGSTDATAKIVGEWQDEIKALPIATSLVSAHDKAGIPYARNRGIQKARGRVIAFCDADDTVRPEWVRAFSGLAHGVAGGHVLASRPDGTPAHHTFPDGLTETGYLPHAGGCNMAMVREDVVSVGGFDESLPSYGCDDVDISWRMQEAGFPISYFPDAIVDYNLTPRSGAVRKTFQTGIARMAIALRYPKSTHGNPPKFADLTAHSVKEVVLLPGRLLRPRGVPRARVVRAAVTAAGRATGYWVYGFRDVPPHYGVAQRPSY